MVSGTIDMYEHIEPFDKVAQDKQKGRRLITNVLGPLIEVVVVVLS